MHAIYKNKWTHGLPKEPQVLDMFMQISENEWATGIGDMNAESIRRGIDKCKKQCEWPPSIAEFRQLGLPSPQDLGLPSPLLAMRLAAKGLNWEEWDFPIIKEVVDEIGHANFKNGYEKDISKQFIEIYLRKCQEQGLKKNG